MSKLHTPSKERCGIAGVRKEAHGRTCDRRIGDTERKLGDDLTTSRYRAFLK